MRIIVLFSTLLFLLFGCVSSEKNSHEDRATTNMVSLSPPNDQKQEESTVYIDLVELASLENQDVLLISGSFPDACTHLKSSSHTLSGETLEITLEAWRNPSVICAQVLTSFSYYYKEVPEKALEEITSVTINSRTYQVKKLR